MRRHERFEWDQDKARSNQAKHGVSFEAAMLTLMEDYADLFHWLRLDERSFVEERWITIGCLPQDRNLVLLIVWTPRGENDEITRIISARRITRKERKDYENRIYETT